MKNKLSSEYRIKKALCKSEFKDVPEYYDLVCNPEKEYREKKTINIRKHDKR